MTITLYCQNKRDLFLNCVSCIVDVSNVNDEFSSDLSGLILADTNSPFTLERTTKRAS